MVQNKRVRLENEQQVTPGGDLLTVREVAHRLRVDDTTVRRWIKAGALEAVLLPHKGKRCGYRIKKMTLDTLVNDAPLLA